MVAVAGALVLTACTSSDAVDPEGTSGEASGTQTSGAPTTSAQTGTAESSGEDSTGSDAETPIELPDGTEMIFEQGALIPMRDGVHLSANIFRPADPGEYPVLMAMTPYNKDLLPVEYEEDDGEIEVSEYAGFEQADPAYWVPRGYVVVSVDCRGMGLSEGDMALLTDLEATDYYDTIEWLAARGWSNGKVGLNGVSYMALNQWKAAELHPPHLAAIMPWEGFTDVYRDFAYHGGIGGSAFFGGWWEQRILPSKNPAAAEQPLLQEVEEHPLYGDFYDTLTPLNLDSIDVPAYVVASWPDHGLHTRGTIVGFEEIGSTDKWMEIHGRKKWEWYYSDEALARQERFFDHFLLGEANGMSEVPAVTYEVRDAYYEGEMRTSTTWPPSGAQVALHLDASTSSLAEQSPDAPSTARSTVADGESGTLRFSHTFSAPTEVTGSMNLRLWLSVEDANDADLFVGVQKYDADGVVVPLLGNDVEEGQVANGWLRASHRALDRARSTPTRPFHPHTEEVPVPDGDVVEVQIEIHPSSTAFEVGERMDVVIGGADLEESGQLHFGAIADSIVDVHTGPEHPSQLVFTVVEPD